MSASSVTGAAPPASAGAQPIGKRASATGTEQERRQAWGREWGAAVAAAVKQAKQEG